MDESPTQELHSMRCTLGYCTVSAKALITHSNVITVRYRMYCTASDEVSVGTISLQLALWRPSSWSLGHVLSTLLNVLRIV